MSDKNLLPDLLKEGDDGKPFLVNDAGQKLEFPTFDVIDERTAEDFKVLYHSEHVYRMDEQRQRLAAEDERNDLRARAWDLELIVTRAEGLGHRTVPIEAIREIYPRE